MRSGIAFGCLVGSTILALSACAGRDPQPIASVQPQDAYSDCTMIRAEIEANNANQCTELGEALNRLAAYSYRPDQKLS